MLKTIPNTTIHSGGSWDTLIATERLYMVPFHTENVADVYGKFVRANVDRFVSHYTPADLAAEKDFLESQIQNEFDKKMLWRFVYNTTTGEFLGTIGLRFRDNEESPEIGLWLAPEFQGKWYGSEAYAAILKWTHENYPQYDYVIHRCLARNPWSIALAQNFWGVEILREVRAWWENEELDITFHIPIPQSI